MGQRFSWYFKVSHWDTGDKRNCWIMSIIDFDRLSNYTRCVYRQHFYSKNIIVKRTHWNRLIVWVLHEWLSRKKILSWESQCGSSSFVTNTRNKKNVSLEIRARIISWTRWYKISTSMMYESWGFMKRITMCGLVCSQQLVFLLGLKDRKISQYSLTLHGYVDVRDFLKYNMSESFNVFWELCTRNYCI